MLRFLLFVWGFFPLRNQEKTQAKAINKTPIKHKTTYENQTKTQSKPKKPNPKP